MKNGNVGSVIFSDFLNTGNVGLSSLREFQSFLKIGNVDFVIFSDFLKTGNVGLPSLREFSNFLKLGNVGFVSIDFWGLEK